MNFERQLNQANGRLKAANVGVAIEVRGTRLYLRANLPAKKPVSNTKSHYQQRITLSVRVNPAGISLAEIEARKVGALLDAGEFSWQPYIKTSQATTPPAVQTFSISDWITLFETDYFHRRARTPKSITTWEGDYWEVFRRLPQNEALTPEIITAAIQATAPDTKNRKRHCMALQALANFAQIEYATKPLAGNYNPKRVRPRDLPDDQIIADWYNRISNPAWQWAYGIIATFGIRPHEVFHLDSQALVAGHSYIDILGGKTGARRVWAYYPEWIDTFNLRSPLVPAVNGRNNSELGERCTQYFRRDAELPFKPYDLRHCWAVRTLQFGLDITLAAQQMGHSTRTHTELYHHWITDRHHQRAFDALTLRSDRPVAPKAS